MGSRGLREEDKTDADDAPPDDEENAVTPYEIKRSAVVNARIVTYRRGNRNLLYTVKTRNKVEGAPGQGTLAILTFARCLPVVPLNPLFYQNRLK